MREFNSLRLVSFLFFPRGFTRFFWVLFLLFFTRFRKSSCFLFFSLLSVSLFSLRLPLTLRLKKLHVCHPWYVPSLSFRTFSLSLFSRRRGKGIRVALESALFKAGRFSRARDARRFFFNALRFFCKFLGEEKPSLPRRTSFKRKRRKFARE